MAKNKNNKRYGVSAWWQKKDGWRIRAEFPPLGRRVRTIVEASLFVFLLVLIAKVAGIELSAMFEVIKQVITILIQL